jgi:stress response protein SCP2
VPQVEVSVQLTPGQNTALEGAAVRVTVTGAVDLTALVLSADGKVSGDHDMVFFNAPEGQGVQLSGSTLTLDLDGLRPGAERIALVASPQNEDATFATTGALELSVGHGGSEVSFTPTPQGDETALILCEVYSRNKQWKLRAVGQGFSSGLAGVATEFGIDISTDDAAPAPPSPAPSPFSSPSPVPMAAAPSLNLTKVPTGAINLNKSASAKIPMTKADKGSLRLRCSLRWDGRTHGKSDLDLYALYIDANGRQSGSEKVVYYKDRGSLTGSPFMQLDQDSQGAGEENITLIAGHHSYVLFCAYSALGNGAGSFSSYRAHVVVDDGQGSQITVPLYGAKKFSYWVAIALLDFTDPSGVSVRQVEQYGRNFSEKRPTLKSDGSFTMSTGKVEFKGRNE